MSKEQINEFLTQHNVSSEDFSKYVEMAMQMVTEVCEESEVTIK